jgi:hypothetical protein
MLMHVFKLESDIMIQAESAHSQIKDVLIHYTSHIAHRRSCADHGYDRVIFTVTLSEENARQQSSTGTERAINKLTQYARVIRPQRDEHHLNIELQHHEPTPLCSLSKCPSAQAPFIFSAQSPQATGAVTACPACLPRLKSW